MSSVLDGTRETSWPPPLAEYACRCTRSDGGSLIAPIDHVLLIDPLTEQTLSDVVRHHLSHVQTRLHDIQRIHGPLQVVITWVLIPSVAMSDLREMSGVARSNVSSISFVSNRTQSQTSFLGAEPYPGALHVREDTVTCGSNNVHNNRVKITSSGLGALWWCRAR